MSNSRKQKWRGAGGRCQMPWGWCCASLSFVAFPLNSAKNTHAGSEEDGRGIAERHRWVEMSRRGGGLALARRRWRVAERGCCQCEAPLESLWLPLASVRVWGWKTRFSCRIPKRPWVAKQVVCLLNEKQGPLNVIKCNYVQILLLQSQ